MSLFKNMFSKKKNNKSTSQPVFISKRMVRTSIYETYKADDTEVAKAFLLQKKVEEKQYFIVVETPNGNWGMDRVGLYLEKLLPWQTDMSLAKCKGVAHHPTVVENSHMAARKIIDNYVTKITCGQCAHEWDDGVRYQDFTVVQCPNCKTCNKVDTTNWFVISNGQALL